MIDYLTCGSCLTEFPLQKIVSFIEHKRNDCLQKEYPDENTIAAIGLQCLSCSKAFMTAVGLLFHVQASHNIQLFLQGSLLKSRLTDTCVGYPSSQVSTKVKGYTPAVCNTPTSTDLTSTDTALQPKVSICDERKTGLEASPVHIPLAVTPGQVVSQYRDSHGNVKKSCTPVIFPVPSVYKSSIRQNVVTNSTSDSVASLNDEPKDLSRIHANPSHVTSIKPMVMHDPLPLHGSGAPSLQSHMSNPPNEKNHQTPCHQSKCESNIIHKNNQSYLTTTRQNLISCPKNTSVHDCLTNDFTASIVQKIIESPVNETHQLQNNNLSCDLTSINNSPSLANVSSKITTISAGGGGGKECVSVNYTGHNSQPLLGSSCQARAVGSSTSATMPINSPRKEIPEHSGYSHEAIVSTDSQHQRSPADVDAFPQQVMAGMLFKREPMKIGLTSGMGSMVPGCSSSPETGTSSNVIRRLSSALACSQLDESRRTSVDVEESGKDTDTDSIYEGKLVIDEETSQNATDADVQSEGFEKETEDKSEDSSMCEVKCCDNQKCGITVIPGTHETIKKCCAAIIPKKRKRHMEIKHMPNFWSRYGRRRLFCGFDSRKFIRTRSSSSSSTSSTIYIDVQPSSGAPCRSSNIDSGGTRQGQSCGGINLEVNRESSGTDGVSFLASGPISGDKKGSETKTSVILKPGNVYSIPFSSNSSKLTVKETISSASSSFPASISEEGRATSASLSNVSCSSAFGSPRQSFTSYTLPTLTLSPQSSFYQPNTTASIPAVATDDAGSRQNLSHDNESDGFLSDRMEIGLQTMDEERGQLKKRRYPTSKPFKCDQCENSFNQRIHLKKHMSKHTGVKPFKCNECDYSTVERSHLKVHIRIHTGEKPFKCTYCEYATAQNSTLKIHLKRHHGYKPMECPQCHKSFSQPDSLREHQLVHQDDSSQVTLETDLSNSVSGSVPPRSGND